MTVSRHIEVLFCDDVRREMHGKLSFMGVYTENLIVPRMPVVLPKFCIVTRLVTPAGQPFERVDLQVFKDDELLQSVSPDPEKLARSLHQQNSGSASSGESEGRTIQVVQFIAEMTPFRIDRPFRFRVLAETEVEGEVLRAAVLDVVQQQLPPPSPDVEVPARGPRETAADEWIEDA